MVDQALPVAPANQQQYLSITTQGTHPVHSTTETQMGALALTEKWVTINLPLQDRVLKGLEVEVDDSHGLDDLFSRQHTFLVR